MFRIIFDPNTGYFHIEIATYMGLAWRRVVNYGGEGELLNQIGHRTYKEVREYVTEIGLDQLYVDKSENTKPGFKHGTSS